MPKPARNRRPEINGHANGNSRSGAIMVGVNWISFVAGLLGLLGYIYQLGVTNANTTSEFKAHHERIDRNFKEDIERHKAVMDAMLESKREFNSTVTRIDTQIGSMAKLQTEVAVIQNQLSQMNDTLKDLRRVMERALTPTAVKVEKR